MGEAYRTNVLYRKQNQLEKVRDYANQALESATQQQRNEYIAAAKGNLSWIAFRMGDLQKTEQLGREALDLWKMTGMLVFPFQWLGRWPLLGAALAQNQIAEALEQAKALLDMTQQKLADEVTALLETSIREWDKGNPEAAKSALEQCAPLAQQFGYL